LKFSAETTGFPDLSSISFRVLPATAPAAWASFFNGTKPFHQTLAGGAQTIHFWSVQE
jgi:hypothetical protein